MPGFSPVGVPTAPAIDIAGAFAKARQDAPVDQAQADEKTAAAKLATERATSDLDNDKITKMLPAITANPALANTPAFQQILGPILQKRGLSGIPRTATGDIDMKALTGLLVPKTIYAQKPLSPDEIQKVLEQPESARPGLLAGAGYDLTTVPSEILHGEQIQSEVSQRITREGYQKEYDKAAQGLTTPQEFLGWVASNRKALVGAQVDPSNIERDPSILKGLGSRTQADIQKLIDMGLLDKAKAAAAFEDIRKAQTVEDLNRVRAKYVGAQIHHMSVEDTVIVKNANTNAQRVATYALDVGNRIAIAQGGSWAQRNTLLTSDLKTLAAEKRQTETDITRLRVAAQAARNQDEDPGPEITDGLTEAEGRLATINGLMGQIKDPTLTATALGKTNANITGNETKVPGSTQYDPSKIAGRSKSQPWVVKMQDGSIWDTRATPKMMKGPDGG
jgi:hypothetical protein